jgi:hypothetical protein
MEDKKCTVVAHVCGTGWGIGSYSTGGDGNCDGYGIPWHGMNPNNFFPDYECCTEEEIAAHKKAKEEWKP